MSTRPFQLVTATRLARAKDACAQALEDWAHAWQVRPTAIERLHVQAHDRDHGHTSPGAAIGTLATCATGPAFVWVRGDRLAPLADWLFGVDDSLRARLSASTGCNEGSIGRQVACDAMQDLLRRLLGPFAGQSATSLDEAAAPPQGVTAGMPLVDLEATLGGWSFDALLRLPDEAASIADPSDRHAPHRTPPEALPLALRHQTVTVSADLGEVEVDLRTLQALAIGDVIRFDTLLDQPLRLRVDGVLLDDTTRAHPGMLGGRRALEITPYRKTP